MAKPSLLPIAILVLAAVLRLAWLDVKPAHFDEGVNGWFVDQMTRQGFYHYDPSNFHGPLHFYVLFAAQTLLGRDEWVLRLPVALISTACVGLVFAFRRHLGERACLLAALAMAISPAMVFYGRYAIHETWLLFFLLLTMWGIAGLWREGRRKHLWALAMGLTGMILTKETYVIHVIAMLLAWATLRLFESASPSAPLPFSAQRWTRPDVENAVAASAGLVAFFYSGALLDWSSLPGLWQTFVHWAATGTGGHTGHEKEWHYWLELLGRYEWPALAGLVASAFLVAPRTNRFARYLAIYAAGALTAYSLIAYKTPWCLIVLMWPLHLLFGFAIDRAMTLLDQWTAAAAAGMVCVFSLATAFVLNFREFTNEDEPYVYVQTRPDVNKLLDPLRALVAADARNHHLIGYVLLTEQHPLPWLLGDFTRVNMVDPEHAPAQLGDAEFVVADESHAEEVEGRLSAAYFTDELRIRGNAEGTSRLYLRAETFRACFPGRQPELIAP